MSTEIVLPADVYDTLELSALAFGGIGHGSVWDDWETEQHPCCVYGHTVFAGIELAAILRAGLTGSVNDSAVPEGKRLSWKAYCRKLNITRGN